MKSEPHVSRDVEPSDLQEMLDRPPRALLAFCRDGQVDGCPIALRTVGEQCWISLPQEAAGPKPDQEVTILIDDGTQWFDLRAIRIHGRLRESAQPGNWIEVVPSKTAAWHYGSMREVDRDERA